MTKHLFITGKRLSGKSSLIQKCLWPYLEVTGGFFIQRVFSSGEYAAFRMIPLHTGEPYRLNMEDGSTNLDNVIVAREAGGCWHSYPQIFETTGVECIKETLRSGRKILLLDELGHIEMEATYFQKEVFRALDSPVHVLGVLKDGTNSFLNRIQSRQDVACISLLPEFQNQVEELIRLFLQKAAGWRFLFSRW